MGELVNLLGVFSSLLNKAFANAPSFSSSDNIDEFYSGLRGIYNAHRPQGTVPPNALNALIIAFKFDIRYVQISMDYNTQSIYVRFGEKGTPTTWNNWRLVLNEA